MRSGGIAVCGLRSPRRFGGEGRGRWLRAGRGGRTTTAAGRKRLAGGDFDRILAFTSARAHRTRAKSDDERLRVGLASAIGVAALSSPAAKASSPTVASYTALTGACGKGLGPLILSHHQAWHHVLRVRSEGCGRAVEGRAGPDDAQSSFVWVSRAA